MKLALTLRHLASGNKYASMKFGWRVLHNTLSLVVREVCQAIIDEYVDEVLVCPSTPDGWRAIADKFFQRWNLPHIHVGHLKGSTWPAAVLQRVGPNTSTTRDSTPLF